VVWAAPWAADTPAATRLLEALMPAELGPRLTDAVRALDPLPDIRPLGAIAAVRSWVSNHGSRSCGCVQRQRALRGQVDFAGAVADAAASLRRPRPAPALAAALARVERLLADHHAAVSCAAAAAEPAADGADLARRPPLADLARAVVSALAAVSVKAQGPAASPAAASASASPGGSPPAPWAAADGVLGAVRAAAGRCLGMLAGLVDPAALADTLAETTSAGRPDRGTLVRSLRLRIVMLIRHGGRHGSCSGCTHC
jgi:hypothetical protein